MKIKNITYNQELEKITTQLQKGAFLCLKSGNDINIMTISWGLIGFMWNRPIFQILIRTSRYSYSLVQKTNNFTVSFPVNQNMDKELLYCGKKSGRDYNKIIDCNFTLLPAQKVNTPIIANCGLYYECKILAKQKLPIEQIDGDSFYEDITDQHYHMMYYGEIISCYKIGESLNF